MFKEVDFLERHRVWKHHLPSYFKISRHKFDVERLQKELNNSAFSFSDVYSANDQLCKNHPTLAESVQDHYEQISLTTFDPGVKVSAKKLSEESNSSSMVEKYRLKISERKDQPKMDERNYNYPAPGYTGSYFEECVNSFKEKTMRVRLVKLKAGEKVDFHIDYDPSYAIRIVIPIVTNENVINMTRRGKVVESVHLPADGSPWFLNTGFSHAVENRGSSDRIILMFSLQPSNLLAEISDAWKSKEQFLS